MNILILGDSNSIFLKNFCKYVLDRKDNICIFSYTNTHKFSELYVEMGIKEIYITPYLDNKPLRLISIVPLSLKKMNELNKLLPFGMSIDVMHVHYVDPSLLLHLFAFWVTAKKRILTFWGSDIFRISECSKKVLIPFLHMASSIVFMISAQKDFFCDIYGNKFNKQIRIVDFGNELLDLIDSIRSQDSKRKCKKKFGLAVDKVTIHIGYNKSETQQHIKILEQVCRLPRRISEKIQIVFPWGYGEGDLENIYVEKMKSLLEGENIDYVFLKDFLQGRVLAEFRMSCDIFVYGQTTDAMSDSCLEYVYCGSLFLCPDWLWKNYLLVNRWTKKCVKYLDFFDLGDILYRILDKKEYEYSNYIEDEMRETIYKCKSWGSLSDEWRKCYE